ncbi:glycosyltransferase family 2 protein [Thermodesulfobacteriota bacterium]
MINKSDYNSGISAAGTSQSFEKRLKSKISVMLPTFRRVDALQRTLASLETQTLASADFEIVVVDDGSRDGTESFLQDFAEKTKCNFSYLALSENGGPARTRNFGLSRCRGDIVLIIGDDIEPATDLVESHLRFHEKHPEESYALLGRVTFPDELKPSSFMLWLEHGGRKYFFNYQDLVPGKEAEPLFFYTCNVSVKKALLDRTGWFDESFPYASHEDLELGYRLAGHGMKMIYLPQAVGSHFHMLTIQGITRRIYLMGYSAELFWQKVGDRGGRIRQTLRSLISITVSTSPGVALWRRLAKKQFDENKQYPIQWNTLLALSFFIGLSDSKRGKAPRV